ncbi:MAG: glutamine-hydrolyzing GMP synthase [Myxococcales bacterium]|nr:glutamine-hydrolyzing GMP synthase [Myxococcales bacterium]
MSFVDSVAGRVLILDFGSQYTQLIARRVREQHVYCEVHPFDWDMEKIRQFNPKGLILSGGPETVTEEGAPVPDPAILDLEIPILGICYGMQWLGHHLGGLVAPSAQREYGRADIEVLETDSLLAGFPLAELHPVWMSHGDQVKNLPEGFSVLARSTDGVVASMGDDARSLYGVQFHPEVVHTPRGAELLRNFLLNICGVEANWTMDTFVADSLRSIQEQVGPNGRVVCGLSGGVDSAVAAALIHRAIGSRLTCIFVDHGLMRKDEGAQVIDTFTKLGFNLIGVDASERFLAELEGVDDPEQKRKIIGRVFIEVFEEEAQRIGTVDYLAQGTLYPDVIESVSLRGPSHMIKSHHNVGGLPERMRMELVEPLRELFKDEVREVGRVLGLSDEVVDRKPFPGPGMAVRILGEITRERLAVLQEADAIYRQELQLAPCWTEIWQCFAVLLPVRTVGVMGDQRTYENVLALRAVSSTDGMTADWYPIPHDVLARISTRIINEVRGINRVTYDISSKPPATIEWE